MSKRALQLVNNTLFTEGTGLFVTEVFDALENLLFQVREEDAKKGIPLSHTHCPVAECILRSTEAIGVVVSPRVIYAVLREDSGDNYAVRYLTTLPLREEIVHFDRTSTERKSLSEAERTKLPLSFAPGTYVMKAPSNNHVLGSKHVRKDSNHPKKRGERTPRFSLRAQGLLRTELRSVGRAESR